MPPKMKTPAPIDRPLSKAYLREFSGWSTSYPPGLSDPSSLRTMENIQINRDGSARVRPGLRYMSYATLPAGAVAGVGIDKNCVGAHEPFFLNDGSKAYLFAVREADNTVGFRVLVGSVVKLLTAAGVDFSIPQGAATLAFSAATTYVKYLQIDNKIFALSNAGETMRLFNVGASKSARRLNSIERPNYDLTDKLTVVHPDAAWVTGAAPTTVRKNLLLNPSFETNVSNWTPDANTAVSRSTTVGGRDGGNAARLETIPARTNLIPAPVSPPDPFSLHGWANIASAFGGSVQPTGTGIEVSSSGSGGARRYSASSRIFDGILGGQGYYFAWNLVSWSSFDDNGTNTDSSARVSCYIEWFNSAGVYISNTIWDLSKSLTREVLFVTAPSGAAKARVNIGYVDDYSSASLTNSVHMRFKDVLMAKYWEPTSVFTGDSGAGYYWTGTAGDSASVYQPSVPMQITSSKMSITAALHYMSSIYAQADPTARNFKVGINWYNASSTFLSQTLSAAVADADGVWTRNSVGADAPAGATQAEVVVWIDNTPRGEYHYLDDGMLEQAAAVGTYFDGDTADTSTVLRSWDGTAHGSASTEGTYAAGTSIPAAETPTANTLVSNAAASNVYNFGYFYTVSNEVGESAASMVTVLRVQRRWTGWKWEAANASGEPNGTLVSDPNLAADQLVASMPQAVYDAVKAEGATGWNLYMLTWSDQDSVPVEGILLGSKPITASGTYGAEGWIRNTPALANSGYAAQLPTATNRYNYSVPSSAAQGLVASDRMILVDDPVSPAVIRWSSNQQGEYTNFTAAKGGGYKTLTSGNLYVPASVKLWQNPQSVDTLTIMCQGVDGQNTSYYMAPATVSQQSETVTVMGFEETTATPGTVSPYGCEVFNNALYHPLDTELMKSTASNYNINHKPQTEQIVDSWTRLLNKQRIVSSQLDGRLYFIVHNPQGESLLPGCMGNEIWVFDAMAPSGTWSRWLIQASSLRKIENGGKVYMSVTRPDGIYYLDPFYDRDDVVDPADRSVDTAWISWQLETNTQGANRAHDAWCHLQQVQMSLGNFKGSIEWGITARDVHGKDAYRSIVTKDTRELPTDLLPVDITATLRVARDVMEWRLFAKSVTGEQGVGQIDFVQYRYTPVSVNVGYEYGEVETFEYGRSQVQLTDRTTDNGVPQPFADTLRP